MGIGLRPILDPDFGWHLRSGTDFLARNLSVIKTDPYSHTLPQWPWVNHEWLADGIVAGIYNHIGPLAVIILFALLIAGTFLLAALVERVQFKYGLLAAIIGLLAALPILGVRMQVITLLGMAWLLWTLYRYRREEVKHLWIVPLLFIAWANLHGGFTIGLFLLALFWVCEGAKYLVARWRAKWYAKLRISEITLSGPQLKHLLGVGILSGLATLINPYGLGLYYDFYKLFINPFAIAHIGEWQPVAFNNAIATNFLLYLILFAIILIIAYRKIEPTRWVITGVFLYLSFLYWRNMPFFMIMSVGFLAEIFHQHTHLVFASAVKNRWFIIGASILTVIVLSQRVIDVSSKLANPANSFRLAGYPIDAVQWAKANPDKIGNRMFNEYDFGGFLVWQFPEQKVFVDGRMPFWQIDDRFPFFEEQYSISAGSGSIEMLEDKYDVDWMILRPNRPLAYALLGQDHWTQLYRDDFAAIYRKIKTRDEKNI